MSKRTAELEDSDIDVSSTDSENELEVGEVDEAGEEVVNVDFDYFDLEPDVDFQAFKTFLQQLMGDDALKFDISSLADLLLRNCSVGTTIKTGGKESDPFAILTVLNLNENKSNPTIKKLINYVVEKTKHNLEFHLFLKNILQEGSGKGKKVGFIFSERMINMPVEVVPPMYKMLLEEMEKAENAHEKYEFDYFLVISKVYKLVAAKVEEESLDNKSKRKKISEADSKTEELDYFHYEDIILEENAKYKGKYNYDNQKQDTDSRRVFTEYGIDPMLSILLLDKKNLAKSVPEMEAKFPPF